MLFEKKKYLKIIFSLQMCTKKHADRIMKKNFTEKITSNKSASMFAFMLMAKSKKRRYFFESMQRVKKGSSIKNRMYSSSSSSGVGCVILCFIRIRMTLLLCLNRIAKKTNKESYLVVLKRQWRIQFHIQIYGVIALSMNIYINRNVCATIFAGLFFLILIFHLIN